MKENIVEILDNWLKNRLDGVHTCIPGKIIEYYGHDERKAKVKPLVRIKDVHGDMNEIEEIDNVPVLFFGSMNTKILFPLSSGDGCLLLFSESNIGNFLNSSSFDNPVDAETKNRFDLSDCIAIPGLWSFENLPEFDEEFDEDDFVIIHGEGFVSISGDGDIKIKDESDNEIEMSSSGVKIEDTNGNEIEMGTGKVSINGDSLEILQ